MGLTTVQRYCAACHSNTDIEQNLEVVKVWRRLIFLKIGNKKLPTISSATAYLTIKSNTGLSEMLWPFSLMEDMHCYAYIFVMLLLWTKTIKPTNTVRTENVSCSIIVLCFISFLLLLTNEILILILILVFDRIPSLESYSGVGTGMLFPCCHMSKLRCACQSLGSILWPSRGKYHVVSYHVPAILITNG